MSRLSKFIAFLTIAINGYELALPGVGVGIRPAVAYGLFLGNVLVIGYLVLFAGMGGLARLAAVLRNRSAASFSLLIMALGVLGMVSAGFNETSVLDLGQAARLLLHGAYFLLVVYWTRRRGPGFALKAYLFGIASGGIVNLSYTLANPPLIVFDVLPVLHASNGAGGLLALGIVLGAWLWMIAGYRSEARVAVAASVIGLLAVGLSYSKTAMLIGFLGAVAWFGVLFRRSAWRSWLHGVVACSALLTAIVLVKPLGVGPEELKDLVIRAVQVKFGNMTLESRFGIDDYNVTGSRYAYWPMTFRVLFAHPALGVGYSGLYGAYGEARKGYEHLAVIEVTESRATNPHNSFLYYIGANGFIALWIVVALFVKSLRLLLRACAPYGLQGRIVWACLAAGYLVYGFTLPTLFNTEVLYLPVAVAVAPRMSAWRRAGAEFHLSRMRGFMRAARRPTQRVVRVTP